MKFGNLEKSRVFLQKSLVIARLIYGEEHINLAISYYYLAQLLWVLDDYEQALLNMRKANKLYRTNNGFEHVMSVKSL